jgi:hypothetical protein
VKRILILLASLAILASAIQAANRNVPKDLSKVRGFNYQSAATKNHTDHWLSYNPAHTDFELDLAKRLNLNQARVFISYAAYAKDKKVFFERVQHLIRAAHKRGIGVMIVVMYDRKFVTDKAAWPNSREYASDLVKNLGKEPGLTFWDVSNEPECCNLPPTEANRTRMAHAVYMAGVFHELDPKTPVTIGATFADNMIEMGEAVDVLTFHDYSPTRRKTRAKIEMAKQYAAKVGKQVMNTEIGCSARANPYDVTLEEHMKAGIGWYIWELMITGQWGRVQGVFYGDGTIRDPSMIAALFGFFRNRGTSYVPELVDNEGWIGRAIGEARKWLAEPSPAWDSGLDAAETMANLLESGQLIGLNDPPTRQVDMLRAGQPDLPALHALVTRFIGLLEPFQMKK